MRMFLKLFGNQILWFGLFSITVLGVVSYLILNDEAQTSVTKQLLNQQQTIARAEASNIISYLQTFGNSVAVLAQQSSVNRRDASVVLDMDIFVEQRRDNGLISGVVLTDSNGIVRFNSNVLGTRDIGESLADRAYFVWAKNQAEVGEYYISEPVIGRLGASKGQTIIVVSPTYQNDEFNGVVAASLKLEPLVERFFGLMKLSDQTKMYLIDRQGKLLYSKSNPDSAGSNFSGLFLADKTFTDNIKKALNESREGQLKTKTDLIAYAPVLIGSQKWLLIVMTPREEAIDLVAPFYVRQVALLILTLFTILLFGAIAIRKSQA